MPVTYRLDGNTAWFEFHGETTRGEVDRVILNALADPAWKEPIRCIADVRRSTSLLQRTPESVRAIAEAAARHGDRVGGRIAVIADRAVAVGLVKIAATFASPKGLAVAVFRNDADALRWIETQDAPGARSRSRKAPEANPPS
jgi:hypothetical protein